MSEQKQLLTQYLNGDTKAIQKIVEEYKDDLYNLCFRLTFSRFEADDLFQKTWEKAIKNLAKFNGNSFKNWIYTVCINSHRDVLRKNARLKKIGGIDFEKNKDKEIAISLASDGISAEDTAIKNETKIKLVSLVNQLPHKQKSVIVLHYFQGLSYDETASVLSIPQGTVKSRLNAAKKNLKLQLANSAQACDSPMEEKLYAEYS
jgi:RNA polymerase sigma-70 factor (ECF subfamily)